MPVGQQDTSYIVGIHGKSLLTGGLLESQVQQMIAEIRAREKLGRQVGNSADSRP